MAKSQEAQEEGNGHTFAEFVSCKRHPMKATDNVQQ